MKFKRAPSKLPANRVLDSNQYLHLSRRLDEMGGLNLGRTRGDRRSDYARSRGIVNIINVGAGGGSSVYRYRTTVLLYCTAS